MTDLRGLFDGSLGKLTYSMDRFLILNIDSQKESMIETLEKLPITPFVVSFYESKKRSLDMVWSLFLTVRGSTDSGLVYKYPNTSLQENQGFSLTFSYTVEGPWYLSTNPQSLYDTVHIRSSL